MLKGLGYTVTGVASSGEDAISKAESTFPDLVLMDIMLKGEHGRRGSCKGDTRTF